jgi:hypothetical protein
LAKLVQRVKETPDRINKPAGNSIKQQKNHIAGYSGKTKNKNFAKSITPKMVNAVHADICRQYKHNYQN